MLNRTLDIVPPSSKEAAQISLILWLTVLCVLSPGAIMAGQVGSFSEGLAIIAGFFSSLLLSTLLYFLLRLVAGRLVLVAIPVMVIGLTITAFLQMLADYQGQHILDMIFADHRMPDESPQALLFVTSVYWSLSALNMALLCVASASRKIRSHEMEMARAQVVALQAQLNLLRMQLNPHFMCNSLNAISSLILEERYFEANRMSERLADFLRAALESQEPENRLQDELSIVECYIDMEAARFGSRLEVAYHVDPEIHDAIVPNFILQPLIENAFKHGVERSSGAVQLRVKAHKQGSELSLVVENEAGSASENSPEKRASTGIGLSNTAARLKMMFGNSAGLTTQNLANGYRVTIRLPFQAHRHMPA